MSDVNRINQYLNECFEKPNKLKLKKAIKIGNTAFDKGNNDAGFLLGQCYVLAELYSFKFGSFERAIAIYENLIKNNYENNEVFLKLGLIYANLEQYKNAYNCYYRYHELEPNDAEGTFLLAKLYLYGDGVEQNLQEAKNLFDSIQNSNYANKDDMFAGAYAKLCEELGLYCDAHRWYERSFFLADEDLISKADYTKEIILLNIHHNPFNYSSISSLFKGLEKYMDALDELDRKSKGTDAYELVHEAHIIIENEINIFQAEVGANNS